MNLTKKIIEKCKNNDSDAQKELYEKYYPIMYGICLRYIKEKQAAEDVMQEGFFIIFTKIKQFKGTGSFEGWMKRIMMNLSLKYLKKKSKKFFYDIDEIDKSEFSTFQPTDNEQNIDFTNKKSVITNTPFTQDEIFDAVSELPDGFRIVFSLYAIDGYKHREIAKKLNISISTSKTQLLRARKQLQEKLYKKALQKQKEKKMEFYKEVISKI